MKYLNKFNDYFFLSFDILHVLHCSVHYGGDISMIDCSLFWNRAFKNVSLKLIKFLVI